MPVHLWLTFTRGLLSKGAVTGVFDMTKKYGDPESSRRLFFLFQKVEMKSRKAAKITEVEVDSLWCGGQTICHAVTHT